MRVFARILCLLAALISVGTGMALAEEKPVVPMAIVSYDIAPVLDWTPSYNLEVPGILLELAHTEGMLSVTVLEADGRSPEEYLSGRLDYAGETLAVSNAQMAAWSDPFKGNGHCLSFCYSYPEGDEEHLTAIWVSSYRDGLLIEIEADTWGPECESLMNAARAAVIESGCTVTYCDEDIELFAALTDAVADENASVQIQLTAPDKDAVSYPLAVNAVILFPNPDDPFLFYPVVPDMPSQVDAILTYEETAAEHATFRAVIHERQIIFLEYSPMQ